MTAKELKKFLECVDDDANVIMHNADNNFCDIRIRKESIIAEKDTASSVHTYERKEIVIIY